VDLGKAIGFSEVAPSETGAQAGKGSARPSREEQLAEALRSREEISALLDTLLEEAPAGFAFFNNDLRFLRINGEFSRISGAPPREHWGRRFAEVLPEIRPNIEDYLQRVLDTGEPELRIEFSGQAGNRYHDLLVSIYPVRTDKRLLGVGAVVVDLTEQKRAERSLRDAQRRLGAQLAFNRSVTDSIAEGIYAVDQSGKATMVNPATERLLGYSASEMLGRDMHELVHFQHADHSAFNKADCPLLKVIRTGEPVRADDDSFTRKDGSIFPVAYASTPLIEDDRVVGAVVAFHDITHQKAAEEALRRSRDELEQLVDARTAALQTAATELQASNTRLEQSNRELQDFASVASHDLQEPLRKIQAFGDRLSTTNAATLSSDGQDYLKRMLNAAGRMQTLINDLLSFSRITTKAQPFSKVDLAQIARDVLVDLETAVERAGAAVSLDPLPTIDADPMQMRQLLQNLIGNALKFRKPGVAPIVRISAEVSSDNQTCTIFVSDNGIGFDEKYLDRIFNVFQRLHGRGSYEGTGIGLAVCRKIAERHGGSITARSTPGEGATFIVTLPMQHEKVEETISGQS